MGLVVYELDSLNRNGQVLAILSFCDVRPSRRRGGAASP